MKLVNQSKISDKAFNAIVTTTKEYDVTPLAYIKLGETKNNSSGFYGRFRCKKAKHYTIVACVHSNWKYPLHDYVIIGTKQVSNVKWLSINTPIIFNSYDEAILFVFFHEWFHYIRKTEQIPVSIFGKNTEPSANRYALAQLELYVKKRVR